MGLVYFGKRYLNTALQRWVSADPLEVHQPGEADANVYAYVRGRALKNIDPLGLEDQAGDQARAVIKSGEEQLAELDTELGQMVEELGTLEKQSQELVSESAEAQDERHKRIAVLEGKIQANEELAAGISEQVDAAKAFLENRPVLGIHSSVAGTEGTSPISGHAWLTFREKGEVGYYGTWDPDLERFEGTPRPASDVRVGLESTYAQAASRYFALTDSEAAELKRALGEGAEWGVFNNCSAWASETTERVTGVDIDAIEPMSIILGAPTPRELGSNINDLESEDRTSRNRPTTVR